MALGAAGAGLVGALVLTGPAPAALFNAVANTLIVVGGNSDPTSQVEWDRIRGSYTGTANPVLISYPADVGVGFPGLPSLSLAGRDTYAGSVDKGSTTTAKAIADGRADGGDVTVYALSLGTDVVGIALVKAGPKKATDGSLTVVEHGGPSFVNSGIWNLVPPFIPGLRNGPVKQGPASSGAEVTSICIKGDSICGLGTNPITAAFYFLPGFDLHGKDYTAAKIGKYSPTTGVAYTPGASGEKPKSSVPTTINGHPGTIDTYEDGTVKKTWVEDGTTWVVIDTGQNPWGRLLRENGIKVPMSFDAFLNRSMPVPEPGAPGPLTRPALLADLIAAVPTPPTVTADPSGPRTARHAIDTPGTIPLTTMLDQGGAGSGSTVLPSSVQKPVAPAPAQEPVVSAAAKQEPVKSEPLPAQTEVENDQRDEPVTGTSDEQPTRSTVNEPAPVDPVDPPVTPASEAGAAPSGTDQARTTTVEPAESAATPEVRDAA
ncbi:PE-PPE domain-containing protein [Tsukamurella spumae]|uniref:PE-PPE domain-containing protein n=1 Tax=Tsukamurella spumae TaxID=44753 RepID=A0A846X4H1_9ACTN|nr:PE-PPE domain-containing protein [Tsukamurella spumae]NKY20567.1 PE-PPE domain-containing protein [Tsukamurella spumae]